MVEKADDNGMYDYEDLSEETVAAVMRSHQLRKDPDLLAAEDGYNFNVPMTTKEDRRRALEDSCQHVGDHDWVEETADLVAFNYHIVAVTLGIVNKKIANLERQKI